MLDNPPTLEQFNANNSESDVVSNKINIVVPKVEEIQTIQTYHTLDSKRSRLLADYIYNKELSPIPLDGIAKEPATPYKEIRSRQEAMDITTDRCRVRKTFFNIGVLCCDEKFDSGLVVVDVDLKGEISDDKFNSKMNGLELWDKFIREHNPVKFEHEIPQPGCFTAEYFYEKYDKLFDTYCVKTGSGGLHYYFNRPVGANLPGKIKDIADIKKGNAYVVSAYSKHPVTGALYLPLGGERPIKDMPDWLLKGIEIKANDRPKKVASNRVFNSKHKPSLKRIQDLVNLLDVEYNRDYNLWIKLFFVLKGIAEQHDDMSDDLLQILLDFTNTLPHDKRVPEKITEKWETETVRSPENGELCTYGSLYYWAKQSDRVGHGRLLLNDKYYTHLNNLSNHELNIMEHAKAIAGTLLRSKEKNAEGHRMKYFYYREFKCFYKYDNKNQRWDDISDNLLMCSISTFWLKPVDRKLAKVREELDGIEDEDSEEYKELKFELKRLLGLRQKVGDPTFLKKILMCLMGLCQRKPSFSMFHRNSGSPTKFNLCLGFKANLVDFDFGTEDFLTFLLGPRCPKGLYRILDHIWRVACAGNWEDFRYYMANITFPIRMLMRSTVAIINIGIQGCGKTRITDFLKYWVYGLLSTAEVQDVTSTFKGDGFNYILSRKLFTVIPEVKRNGIGTDVIDRLKQFITDNEIFVHPKYTNGACEENNSSLMICSNSKLPVLVDDTQRRFAAFEFEDIFKDKPSEFKYNYFDILTRAAFNEETGDYFYSMALSPMFNAWIGDIEIRRIPKTKIMVKMIEASKTSDKNFFDEVFKDHTVSLPSEGIIKRKGLYHIKCSVMLETYKCWCKDFCATSNVAGRTFTQYLCESGFFITEPNTSRSIKINGFNHKHYTFDPKFLDGVLIHDLVSYPGKENLPRLLTSIQ